MASSNLRALQATSNRFSGVASFSPIAVDGGMGTATENAVTNSLAFVANQGLLSAVFGGGPVVSNDVKVSAQQFADILKTQGAGLGAQTAIMQNDTDINDTLTLAATQLGLSAIAPAASNSGGGNVASSGGLNLTAPKPPGESSFIGDIARSLGLSTTQAVLFLAMAGGASFLIYKRASGKKGRRR